MNKTQGLMGVFNNDPTDDMMPASGGAVVNANGSSERAIFMKRCTTNIIAFVVTCFVIH